MMIQSYYTGLSGMQSTQRAINVEADNIANVNTTGFRGSYAEFSSLYSESLHTVDLNSSVDSSNGIGSRVSTTSMVQGDGALELTNRSTDLAISGDGWFGVQNSQGERLYTRAGDFVFDENNDLVTNDGMFVLGTMSDNIDGNILTKEVVKTPLGDIRSQEKLRFPKDLTYPPIPTQNVSFSGNLNTNDELREFGSTVIDTQNNKNNLKLSFTKSEDQVAPGIQWDVKAQVIGTDNTTIYDTQNGKVFFDESGALVSDTLGTLNNNGTAVNVDIGSGFNGIISTNAKTTNASSTNDGTIGGDLVGYEINQNADVIATFTNGKQSSVGKIGLYHFVNDQGLERVSGTKYAESSNSGNAVFYQNADGENVLGAYVENFKLEKSNVDMNESLTQLIILQRAFDSNSKLITTADQMIQKALDMDS